MLLSPLFALIILAIRLTSPGPAIFTQLRYGRNGVPFSILKFRTMYADRGDITGVCQTVPDDPRITPIGARLRHGSLDELPQIINVLRGDMSLIGPRPHAIDMLAAGRRYEELVPYYALRHAVRPGISGWAQANGLRGPTTDPETAKARIDHDIAYIQNQSLGLDLKIIWLTLRHEIFDRSAF